MSLHTQTSFSIDGNLFSSFHSLNLYQQIRGHHSFEILISYDWLNKLGKGLFNASKNFLGKEIKITIKPADPLSTAQPLIFDGIVTGINAGKENDGTNGFCVIRGFSPDILLENDPHIATFERRPLSDIIDTVLKSGGPLMPPLSVKPSNTESLKYIVQYKETAYTFVSRLAARYGEWFFYDGQQLIFGQYKNRQTELIHQVNLLDFDLALDVKPNNLKLNGYDYRQESVVSNDTQSQAASGTNQYSTHMQEVSKQLYSKPSLYKMNYGFSSSAQSQVDDLTTLQYKGKAASMVVIKGRSNETSLRIGDLITVRENFLSTEDHGQFLITSLQHSCTDNGLYVNTFEAIPADTAMPYIDVHAIPYCEPQSATVIENHDPKGLGRVQVRFRWQDSGTTPWIRVLNAHSGSDKGIYFMPEKGEEVWVDFEGGNPEAPFVTGTTYNGTAKTGFGDAQNNLKVIKTRSGHVIRLDDTEGSESITITDKNSNVIYLNTRTSSIEITAPENMTLNARNMNINVGEQMEMNVGGQLLMNVMKAMAVNTPLMTQMIADFLHMQAGKALFNSKDEIKIEAQQLYAAGQSQIMLHSDEKILANSKGELHMKGEQGNKHYNKADTYETAKPEIPAKVIVSFRPKSGWTGEYGFDWLRIKDTSIVGDVEYKKIVGSYGSVYATQSGAVFTQSDAKFNTLKTTRYSPALIPWKKEADGKTTAEYYQSWLCLFPGGKSYNNTKATVQVLVEVEEEPEKIALEFKDEFIKCDKKEITPKSKGSHKLELTVECLKESDTDQEIKVMAYTKKADGTLDTPKLAGKLIVVKNKVRYKANVVFVKVKTKFGTSVNTGKTTGEKVFLEKYMNQGLILLNLVEEELDMTADAAIKTNALTTASGSTAVNAYPGGKQIHDSLETAFNAKHATYKDYYKVFFFDEEGGYMAGSNYQGLNGGAKDIVAKSVVLFNTHNTATTTHELLHAMGLYHTFDNSGSHVFKIGETENIMDYSHQYGKTRISTWKWQWEKVRANVGKE